MLTTKNYTEFRKETIKKIMKESVRCGICKKIIFKKTINLHLKGQHPKEFKKLQKQYYKMITELKTK